MDEGRISRRVRAFRKLKRLQQAELAKRIDISTSTLGRIERGDKIPTDELLSKIAKQLNIDVQELIGESKAE